jgi:flavin-dependent dehydrogenase
VSFQYDVVIVGGGPAGATAAALLAEKGRKVLVLEKDKFPRYQIGESLLPYCYFTLERLGLVDRMKSGPFQRKHAVQFVTTEGRRSTPFYFSKHFDHEASTTWQVLRSEFDQMLLDNAREKGAEVREETQAHDFIRTDGRVVGVVASRKDGERFELRAPMIIDASGRQALAINRNNWRRWEPGLNKTAVWTYYKGVERDEGRDEGTTTIAYLPDKGWFWYIPMQDDLLSVGVVAERDALFRDTNKLSEIFDREAAVNPWIEERLATGRQLGKYYVTKEYSYRSEHCAEDGLVLVGDAFLFLDPVFSSGVYFALRSGELAADAVGRALEENDVSAGRFSEYFERMDREVEPMRKLVYAFYSPAFNVKAMVENHPEVSGDWTDCLIGKLDRDFDALYDAIRELAPLPDSMSCGKPLLTTEKSAIE